MGMSCVSPGFSSSGASMQARRSTPAEPCSRVLRQRKFAADARIEDAHLEPASRAGGVRSVSWHGQGSSISQ